MNKLTKEQRASGEILRGVFKDKIANNECPSILDFHFKPYETYGCLAGDTYIAMGLMTEGAAIGGFGLFLDEDLNKNFLKWLYDFENIFGFNEKFEGRGKFYRVFGDRHSGTLEERLEYVDRQLNEH